MLKKKSEMVWMYKYLVGFVVILCCTYVPTYIADCVLNFNSNYEVSNIAI